MRLSIRRPLALLIASLTVGSVLAAPASAAPVHQLTSLTVTGTTTPTTSATMSYAFEGTLPTRMDVYFVEETTGALRTARVETPTTSGSRTLDWDARWPAGEYRLQRITLTVPRPGFGTETWTPDGHIRAGIVELGMHDLDFAPISFQVSGPQTGELAPAQLTSARLVGSPTVAGQIGVELTTTDEEAALAMASVTWDMGASGGSFDVTTGKTALSVSAVAGAHELDAIQIRDKQGTTSTYFRDGRVEFGAISWSPPQKHTIDFRALDLQLVPASPTAGHTLRVMPQGAEIGFVPQDPRGVLEWRLTALPGSASVTVPLPADYKGWHSTQIKGLTPGVQHTISLTAVGAVGPSAPMPLATVTPSMTTNVFAVPRYRTDRLRVEGLLASQLGKNPGEVREYLVSSGAFRGVQISAVNVQRIASGGNLTRTGSPSVLEVEGDNLRYAGDRELPVLASGFAGAKWVDGGSDLTGDGHTDVFAVDAAGRFRLYPSTGPSRLGVPVTTGTGWGGFRAVFTPGDFNGDRRADVLAVDAAGTMWLYRGNGRSGWLGRVKVGSGWGGFAGVNAARDFNGDGREDVLALAHDGRLILYPGNGAGGWRTPKQIGSGWQVYF